MNLFRSNATLKPLKAHKAGKRSELAAYSKKTLATLGTGSMKQAVQLPQGESLNEWLAVNTVGQWSTAQRSAAQHSTAQHSTAYSMLLSASPFSLPYCRSGLCFVAVHLTTACVCLLRPVVCCVVLLSAADFFNELSMLYGTISELCTDASCPVMSCGRQVAVPVVRRREDKEADDGVCAGSTWTT